MRHGFGPLMEEAGEGNGGGGGGGNAGTGGGAFDMNAFFTRFEATLDSKLSALAPKPVTPPVPDADNDKGDKGDKGKGGADSPRWKQLESELAAEKGKREASEKRAEEKERHGNIRGMLSDFQFANDAAREDAFKTFSNEIKRAGDTDALTGPENEAAKEYIRRRLEDDRSYLLKPKDVGGSGAQNGGSRGSGAPLDIANLKPGISADELQRYRTEIARIAGNALRGQ